MRLLGAYPTHRTCSTYKYNLFKKENEDKIKETSRFGKKLNSMKDNNSVIYNKDNFMNKFDLWLWEMMSYISN